MLQKFSKKFRFFPQPEWIAISRVQCYNTLKWKGREDTMNKTNRAAVILALLAGICIGGAAAAVSYAMPGKASPTVQSLYQQAI